MDDQSTLSLAHYYAKHGRLEEWVHRYLLSDGNNPAFSDGLKRVERTYLGPFKMPIALFSRCCGPEENMKWRVDPNGFEHRVSNLAKAITNKADLPPLIVNFSDVGIELNDGNHRYEAYQRLGVNEVNVIIWITEKQDVDRFKSIYAKFLK